MIFNLPLAEMTNYGPYHCACGKQHELETRMLRIGTGTMQGIDSYLTTLGLPRHLGLVADPNTWQAAGNKIYQLLIAKGYNVTVCMMEDRELHADERTLGRLLIQAEGLAFLLAVGSGVVNDTTRYVAARTSIPYGVVGTAPSMDGYVSRTSPLTMDGFKFTHPGIAPSLVVADPDAMVDAPLELIEAGVGDLLGKYQSQFDWWLGHVLSGEWFCPEIYAAMGRSADMALAAVPGAIKREPAALLQLMEALLYAGVAMQLAGSSRPASGCEHHIAHYWEIMEGRQGPVRLHGDKVGVGTGLAMLAAGTFFAGKCPKTLPEMDRDAWEEDMHVHFGANAKVAIKETSPFYFDPAWPVWFENLKNNWEDLALRAVDLMMKRKQVITALDALGGPALPIDRGYDSEAVYQSLIWGPMVRGRSTILSVMNRLQCYEVFREVAARANNR